MYLDFKKHYIFLLALRNLLPDYSHFLLVQLYASSLQSKIKNETKHKHTKINRKQTNKKPHERKRRVPQNIDSFFYVSQLHLSICLPCSVVNILFGESYFPLSQKLSVANNFLVMGGNLCILTFTHCWYFM